MKILKEIAPDWVEPARVSPAQKNEMEQKVDQVQKKVKASSEPSPISNLIIGNICWGIVTALGIYSMWDDEGSTWQGVALLGSGLLGHRETWNDYKSETS